MRPITQQPSPNAKSDKDTKILLVAIGSLTGIVGVIIQARESFSPDFFQLLVGALIIIILCLIATGLNLFIIFSSYIKKILKNRKYNRIARKYFSDFEDFTKRFSEFTESSRDSYIPGVLNELLNQIFEYREKVVIPSPNEINNLFYSFKKRMDRFDGSAIEFELLIEEFENILKLFNKLWLHEPVTKIRQIGKEKVPNNIKEKYEKNRRKYEKFIDDYQIFGEKVNKEFEGRKIFYTHYETLEEL